MNMQRNTLVTTVLALLALGGLLAWAFAPRAIEVEVAPVTRGAFEAGIEEDARTQLRDRYLVSAPLAGRMQRIALREGDSVAAGAALATLVPMLPAMLDERALGEQRARVEAAQAGVAQAQSRIDSARVALERTRVEMRRTEQLAQQGFVAPAKLDGDRLAQQAAQKELEGAIEGGHVARHLLQQSRAALQVVTAQGGGAGGFVVRAPVAGRVLKIHHTSETVLALGAPLLDLGDTGAMEVVAELLTTDALAARPGTPVRIERWGGPDALSGKVRRVEPAAFTKVSALGVEEQRVRVLIDIDSPQATWAALGDGFRVGVFIITRSEAQALKVPLSAVFPHPAADGRPGSAVFQLQDGRARLTPVVLAARNATEAWVQQGLAADAKVIIYPPASVADGQRVKPRGV